MFSRLRANFIAGIVVILPAILTIWLIFLVSNAINDSILNPLIKNLKPYLGNIYLEYGARTVVFIALVLLVSLIGLATRVIFIRKLFAAGENIFFKIPMIGKVYVAVRQMSKAFLGDRKGVFKAPVLVEYPRKGVHSIAFLTSDAKGEIQRKTKKRLVNVFLPTTPNPTSGILLLVPEEEIIALDMSVEEAMKLVISGGMVAPDELAQATD
jgi:uncharacterized membrane protein